MRQGPREVDGGRQAEVIAFLCDPQNWQPPSGAIEHIQTHGAHVFLGADRALKIKRAIRYDYMDFSTLERRRAVIERELEINRRFAPDLYLSILAITREADGQLAIGGSGPPVEWALVMRRFPDDALLSTKARRDGLVPDVIKALAATVHEAHRIAKPSYERDPVADSRRILSATIAGISSLHDAKTATLSVQLDNLAWAAIDRIGDLLIRRRDLGFVRRCHGDLHLANIILIDNRPVLFDALEFDEALATIDTLYDLAFLIMDLDVAALRSQANLLLNQYLWLSGDDMDLEGLAAMPLFLALRAAIRAMVGLQRKDAMARPDAIDTSPEPARYLVQAIAYLKPPSPQLIAVGGLSGTGKSTVSAALAPRIGACPGALHLRSDLERKLIAGVEETARLPSAAYSPGASADVYRRLASRARVSLGAGHSVIVDAVFQREDERRAIERVAVEVGTPFHGIWLRAPEGTMLDRIRCRSNDASDATEDVARAQLAKDIGPLSWRVIDAEGDQSSVVSDVLTELSVAVDAFSYSASST